VPFSLSWIWTHRYSHCPCVASRSLVTTLTVHFSGDRLEPSVVVYVSWIRRMLLVTIPSMNLLHPIASCSSTILVYRLSLPLHISNIATCPLPLAYSTMHSRRSGPVSTSSSHCSSKSMDFNSASTRPAWLQKRIWEQVSFTCAQLGQRGHWFCSHGRFLLAGAISMTCLLAQIWNIRGTPYSVVWTISQSMVSDCGP
jgi:hypothetical protein